jgi:hypothetical protein
MNKKGYVDWDYIWAIMGILFTVISIGGIVLYGVIVNSIGKADAKHTGYVTAVGYESGIFYGSDVAYFKTDAQSSQEDIYCIQDSYLKTELEELSKQKKQVTIHYKNDYIVWNSDCYRGISIIVGVE